MACCQGLPRAVQQGGRLRVPPGTVHVRGEVQGATRFTFPAIPSPRLLTPTGTCAMCRLPPAATADHTCRHPLQGSVLQFLCVTIPPSMTSPLHDVTPYMTSPPTLSRICGDRITSVTVLAVILCPGFGHPLFPSPSLLSHVSYVSVTKRKFHLTLCFVLGTMWETVFAAYVNVTGVCCGCSV